MFAKENNLDSLKLVDFGLSAKYDNNAINFLTDKCGTASYMAPEVFANDEYSKVIMNSKIILVCGYMECGDYNVCYSYWTSSFTHSWRIIKIVC